MASKSFTFNGAEFDTKNYAAILENAGVDANFHLIQDLLRIIEVGFVFTNPVVILGAQVLEFWTTWQFDDEGDWGTPNIIFSHGDEERVVTP